MCNEILAEEIEDEYNDFTGYGPYTVMTTECQREQEHEGRHRHTWDSGEIMEWKSSPIPGPDERPVAWSIIA
jgi:hypothetical protein